MRKDLSQIVASLISNIGGVQVTDLGDFTNQDLMCKLLNLHVMGYLF